MYQLPIRPFDHVDTVTHLEHRLSINSKAIKLFESYFTAHSQSVSIQVSKAVQFPLTHGIPQGPVLRSIAFTTYTLSLGDIARKYHLGFHMYADDTQIYLSFEQTDHTTAPSAVKLTEHCIDEI